MLVVPLKKAEFAKLLNGEKLVDYREKTHYWSSRLYRVFSKNADRNTEKQEICFKNGFNADAMKCTAVCRLKEVSGEEIGRGENKGYFRIEVVEILGVITQDFLDELSVHRGNFYKKYADTELDEVFDRVIRSLGVTYDTLTDLEREKNECIKLINEMLNEVKSAELSGRVKRFLKLYNEE